VRTIVSTTTDIAGCGHFKEQSEEKKVGLHWTHRHRGLKRAQLGMVSGDAAFSPHSDTEQLPAMLMSRPSVEFGQSVAPEFSLKYCFRPVFGSILDIQPEFVVSKHTSPVPVLWPSHALAPFCAPHRHSTELGYDPSIIVHGGPEHNPYDAEVQNSWLIVSPK